MQKKNHIRRALSVFFSMMLLISVFSSFIVFADGGSDTENKGESSDLPNPVEGLLDPSPADLPVVNSDSYLVYDVLSDTKLIGYQYDQQRAPAAITQIMTVLLALENLELSDTITITKEMYEPIPDSYVRIGFTEGEVVTVEQCLYACLLKSANDACLALAIAISGSEDAFVDLMNERASELGCTATHFTNAYGLSDSEHRTTCQDMALILKEAIRHPDFITISTCASFTIEPTNTFNDRRVLNSANRFVSTPATAYEYYIGGKTGYSTESSYTIIAAAEKDGRRLIGVLLGAGDPEKRYQSMIDLFEYCYTNYTMTMVDNNEMIGTVKSSVTQIEQALSGTGLSVTGTELKLLDYYSIRTTLANGGYSNEVDLSELVITNETRDYTLPVNRRFSDNSAYKIGYLTVSVTNEKDAAIAETSDTEVIKQSKTEKIMPILIGAALFAVLALAILFLIKMIKKRRFNKNHRNPTIL